MKWYTNNVENLVNWNILVAEGKESKSDFLISGELTEISLNLYGCCGYIIITEKDREFVENKIKEGFKSRICF